MTRKVVALIALQAALSGLLVALLHSDNGHFGHPSYLVAFGAAFALVGLFPMHLELRRHAYTATLTEAVFVVALFVIGPLGVVAAAGLGEALSVVTLRQRPLQATYNVVSTVAASVPAATLFHVLGERSITDASATPAALLAVTVFSAFSCFWAVSVLAVVEDGSLSDMFGASAGMATVAGGTSASLGLAGLMLFMHNALHTLLLAPVVAAMVASNRWLEAQRAERLRVERLDDAVRASSALAAAEDTATALATEARELLSGAAALCCAPDADGKWTGVIVDDNGALPAHQDTVTEVLRLAGGHPAREVARDDLPRLLRAALPRAAGLVIAGSPEGGAPDVVLAVARERAMDHRQADATREVLATFASHAALVIANAHLYEEVSEALQRQLDLNIQKEHFVAAVSHELRTPLTGILGSLQTLRRGEGRLEPDMRERLFEMALGQGDRLKRLIDELLLVAAAQHGTLRCEDQAVNLPALLEEVAEERRSISGLDIRVSVEPAATEIVTDGHKLRQVLANLLENAAKYAPGQPVELGATAGEVITITVRDHGPGIPAEQRERIFDRFVQLDQSSTRKQGGAGLGLYLCRQLVELLGGHIAVTEAPGGGSRFTVVLARSLPAARVGAETPAAAPVLEPPGPSAVRARPAGLDPARPTVLVPEGSS